MRASRRWREHASCCYPSQRPAEQHAALLTSLSRCISSAATLFWKFPTTTSLVLKNSHYYFLNWNEIWEIMNAGEEEWVYYLLRNKLGGSDKSAGICRQKTWTYHPILLSQMYLFNFELQDSYLQSAVNSQSPHRFF